MKLDFYIHCANCLGEGRSDKIAVGFKKNEGDKLWIICETCGEPVNYLTLKEAVDGLVCEHGPECDKIHFGSTSV